MIENDTKSQLFKTPNKQTHLFKQKQHEKLTKLQFNAKSNLSPSISLSNANKYDQIMIDAVNLNKSYCNSSAASVYSSSSTASSTTKQNVSSPQHQNLLCNQSLNEIKQKCLNTNISSPVLVHSSKLNNKLNTTTITDPFQPKSDYDVNKRKYLVGLNLFNRLIDLILFFLLLLVY